MTATFVLRPARVTDLAAFERIAAARATGISSLPRDAAKLHDKLLRSAHAFATEDDASGEEIYLFVLEDPATGAIHGSSGIAASAGFHDRFFSYRNEFTVHASAALGAANKMHTLHLCHDLTGVTLLTSFWIDPALEGTAWPQLLSRGRLLFIGAHRERFAERIAAESPGLSDEHGRCPFWDAVGRRFFDMDYPAAEQLTGGRSKNYIAELMPHAPIYVPLLPESAQLAIGQLHPVGELPFGILIDEGFDADTYIDIFDGGPTVEARLDGVRSVAQAWQATVEHVAAEAPPGERWQVVAKVAQDGFRATLAPMAAPPASSGTGAATVVVDSTVAARLQVRAGDRLRGVALDALPAGGPRP
jgi:arginine N-succinyltransferase